MTEHVNTLPMLDAHTRDILAQEIERTRQLYQGGLQLVVCLDAAGNYSHIKIVPAMH